uniref:DUF4455 domain-containing protein n=1 Tax=Cyprinodon variegatus TaxID=28743 RepID=A0A3Q2E947_CYPVA
RQKKIQVSELDQKLSRCERSRREKLKVILKKYCHLLELISFLFPPDVHRLIHDEATALNHALLANQCSIARLIMLLKQENLQQQALIRRHWEDRLDQWRSNKVEEVVQQLRSMKQTKEDLIKQQNPLLLSTCRLHPLLCLPNKFHSLCFSSLVPPTCSSALVSDWFDELNTVNQLIGNFLMHSDQTPV